MAMSHSPDDHMLRALVDPQSRKCSALRPLFINIDGPSLDSDKMKLKYLHEAAGREIVRRQGNIVRQELT